MVPLDQNVQPAFLPLSETPKKIHKMLHFQYCTIVDALGRYELENANLKAVIERQQIEIMANKGLAVEVDELRDENKKLRKELAKFRMGHPKLPTVTDSFINISYDFPAPLDPVVPGRHTPILPPFRSLTQGSAKFSQKVQKPCTICCKSFIRSPVKDTVPLSECSNIGVNSSTRK